jgi:hypothetical protein
MSAAGADANRYSLSLGWLQLVEDGSASADVVVPCCSPNCAACTHAATSSAAWAMSLVHVTELASFADLVTVAAAAQTDVANDVEKIDLPRYH